MSVAHKLLCRVNSSSDSQKAMSSKNPEEALKAFISEDPDSQYTFESERDVPRSEICREGKDKGPKCITLQMHSTKMFAAMQVCPSQTHVRNTSVLPC
ncbi:hypothetical protein AcW1_005959 [Taiwanofungus camphoratus]|nr:hypothetical protein AcW1_005959 [Antrodia cinnamomea]